MENIESYFDNNFYNLDRQAIFSLNKQDNGPINNVISNLKDHCYGVLIYDDKEYIEYFIFYIDNHDGLKGVGLMLNLKLNLTTRTVYTIEFCKLVNDRFPYTDVVDTFNTIQVQARSVFEKMGFFTFGNELDKIVKDRNAIAMVPGSKGILKFPTFDKVSLYRWFFDESEEYVEIDETKTKKVYLLLDSVNNLIKIGQSLNPNLREKTLHGISPKWDIITTWIAPVSEERKLHKLFEHKRKRGEWFDLSFSDLKVIKEKMGKYKNKNCL